MSRQSGPSARSETLLLAAILLVFTVVAFSPARATNFRGYDEWLILSLLSQGILDFPYANRPLNLVWALPGSLLFDDPLSGFLFFHVAWIGLAGVLTYLIARRLWPGAPGFAFLAGTLAIVWAPGDRSRLCSTQMIVYSGCTFGSLLAAWLMLEAWSRRRLALAVAAVLAGALAVLSFEAALAPLGLVPLLFLVAGRARDLRRVVAWTLAVVVLLAAGGLRAILPRWTDPGRVAYQSGTAPDFTPGPLVDRTGRQLRRHLAPVLEVPPLPARSRIVVPVAVAVFTVGILAIARRRNGATGEADESAPSRAAFVVAAGLGLLWAVASYLPFVLNPETHGGERMQFLSTPGVAVLLAAGICGLASFLPHRFRLPAAALMGAWIAASGVARTAALQVEWDTRSAYPDQRNALLELTAVVPDVAPGTLLILLDGGVWPLDLTFRHAVRYFYEGRAVGHDVNALEYLYETHFEPAGVRTVPRPVLNGPWHEAPTLYPYDAVVVLREEDETRRVRLVENWPTELPALPREAVYAPRARIRLGPRLPRLEVLRRPR
jgi:hypothetical protein